MQEEKNTNVAKRVGSGDGGGEDKEGLGSVAALLGQKGLGSGRKGQLPLVVGMGPGVFGEVTRRQRCEKGSGSY